MAKVDIFSGFLGAGKTTLIKKLIAEGYDTKNIVLIENEFGEIGVDTGFLRESGIKINEMVAGCICCTLVGDFGKALNEVIEQYDPDRILIEPSGVGKLSDVIIAVQDLKNDKIELNGFTTVVDAKRYKMYMENFGEFFAVVDAKRYKMYMENFGEFFSNQVEHASSIFLSHQQSMTSAELDEVVKDIRTLNKTAQVVTTDWDQLSGAKMLEVMESDKTLNAELDKLREEAYEELEAHEHEHEHHHHHHHHDDDEHEHCEHHHDHDHDEHEHHHHDHDHDHECGCGHHHHHHHHHHGHDADEVFDEVGAQTSNKYTKAELEDIIDSLDECGEVIRAKGIVENADGGWLEFDYVPGEGEVRETGAEATGMVAVIGTRLNKEKLHELFKLS